MTAVARSRTATPTGPAPLRLGRCAALAVALGMLLAGVAFARDVPLKAAQGAVPTSPFDVDLDGIVDPRTDGVLLMRYLMNFRGDALIAGVVFGANAARTTAHDIVLFLAGQIPGPPELCTVVAAPQSSAAAPLPAETLVQLTASCEAGAPPLAFEWSVSGIPVGNGPTLFVAPFSTTTYGATPSNAFGAAPLIPTTVYIAP